VVRSSRHDEGAAAHLRRRRCRYYFRWHSCLDRRLYETRLNGLASWIELTLEGQRPAGTYAHESLAGCQRQLSDNHVGHPSPPTWLCQSISLNGGSHSEAEGSGPGQTRHFGGELPASRWVVYRWFLTFALFTVGCGLHQTIRSYRMEEGPGIGKNAGPACG
jgi:hypothetical protein